MLVPWNILTPWLGSLKTTKQYMRLLPTRAVHFQNDKAMLQIKGAQQQQWLGYCNNFDCWSVRKLFIAHFCFTEVQNKWLNLYIFKYKCCLNI